MSKYRWQILVVLICLPVAILATGIPLPYLDGPVQLSRPQAVPSGDLEMAWQFKTAITKRHFDTEEFLRRPDPRVLSWQLPYSVGGFSRPNLYEAKNASSILEELSRIPPQRTLLILPTVTAPARRLLRTLAQSNPELGRRLIAVSGDGIPVNALYRDGVFAWPIHTIPVPLVLFTHHNPLGWDEATQSVAPPPGYALRPPNSTEDVLHFAEMIKVIVESVFQLPGKSNNSDAELHLPNAEELRDRLHTRCPPLFDDKGNRLDSTGEYVVYFAPKLQAGNAGLRTLPVADLQVWQRTDRSWQLVRSIEVQTNNLKAEPFAEDQP